MSAQSPVTPNFFILGAGKSGTTSLYFYLAQHPDIFMSPNKEPTFFCDCFQVVKNPADYLALFQDGRGRKRVGEASHAYLSCPKSAPLLRAFCPDAKFVLILRNPVDRAFSLYQHMARTGDEWAPTFEKALALEEKRAGDPAFYYANPQYFYNFMYFRSGLYSEQIQRYYDLFDRDRFLFVTFDELKRNAFGVVRRVFMHLDVDPNFRPNIDVHNKGYGVWSTRGQFFVKHRLWPLLTFLRVRNASDLVRSLMDWNCHRLAPPAMEPETRAALQARYFDDFAKVEELTGLDLSNWRGPSLGQAATGDTAEQRRRAA